MLYPTPPPGLAHAWGLPRLDFPPRYAEFCDSITSVPHFFLAFFFKRSEGKILVFTSCDLGIRFCLIPLPSVCSLSFLVVSHLQRIFVASPEKLRLHGGQSRLWSCMYVCMVITYSRVWINRVRLPILLVAAEQGKLIFPCPRSRLRNWSRETGSAVPSRFSLLVLQT